jgi:hypothetical protein
VLIKDIIHSLRTLGVTDFDVLAHSYGTSVVNRLLRALCGLDKIEGYSAEGDASSQLCVKALSMAEPVVFGTTSVGFSCAFMNALGPDLNLACISNRGGVPWKATMIIPNPPVP